MDPVARALYAATLTAALVPASLSKVGRNGWESLHVSERLGHAPLPDSKPIWINAASVGELSVASSIVKSLRDIHPDLPFFLTYSSETARQLAPQKLGIDAHALPLDYRGVMRRLVSRLQPSLLLLVEQELWPNMIDVARMSSVPIVVVNARMSARTARRHARWLKLTRRMFESLDLVVAQTRADAKRFSFLGARKVAVAGNVKFDASPAPDKVKQGLQLRKRLQGAQPNRPILLLASTRPGTDGIAEEEILLKELAPLQDKFTLILVPRHLERVTAVANLLDNYKIRHVRHTKLEQDTELPACVLGDTMGEMDCYMAAADVVFIGASLVRHGGQNLMEALAQEKPVVIGPHTYNFTYLVDKATRAGAAIQAPDAQSVKQSIVELLDDKDRRAGMGAAGKEVAKQEHGAVARILKALEPVLCKTGLTT